MLLFLSIAKGTWAFYNECATEGSLSYLVTNKEKNKANFQLIVLDVCFVLVVCFSGATKVLRGVHWRAFVSWRQTAFLCVLVLSEYKNGTLVAIATLPIIWYTSHTSYSSHFLDWLFADWVYLFVVLNPMANKLSMLTSRAS